MSRTIVLAALVAAMLSAQAQAAVEPYGTNDAGGFRNVLPPGTAGVDNAFQLAEFEASGTRPPHWDDQLPLYNDLLYASPTLTHDDIAKYFKDATFGVKDDDVESTISPRPGRHDHPRQRSTASRASTATPTRTSSSAPAT